MTKKTYWRVTDKNSGCPSIVMTPTMAVEHIELVVSEGRMADGGWWDGSPPEFEIRIVELTDDEFDALPEGEC